MPYVHCPRCGLLTYSAARWSHVDHCAGCDQVLARLPAKRLTTPFGHLDVEDRMPASGASERRDRAGQRSDRSAGS